MEISMFILFIIKVNRINLQKNNISTTQKSIINYILNIEANKFHSYKLISLTVLTNP